MSDDYVKVLNSNVKNLTFSKVNKLIGTEYDYPVNFQTSIKGNWDVVPVLGPDMEVEKPFKLKATSQTFPVSYSSQYQTKK
jgi:hypothetical protein